MHEEVENEARSPQPSPATKYKSNLSKFNKLISLSQNERPAAVNNCKFDNCKLKR